MSLRLMEIGKCVENNRPARSYPCRRDASQVSAAPLAQITDGLVCKGVQMSGGNILLELLVPRRGVELGKPVAESQKLLAGKLADGGFDLVNGAHVWRNRPAQILG